MASQHGFALAGVAEATASPRREYVGNWLAAGRHGEMDYLQRHREVMLDPREVLAGARSVICVADFYPAQADQKTEDQPRGHVARYAWGDDYHKAIKKRLFSLADALRQRWPNEQYRCAVDTAPVMEREHAMNAGLGWIGKHTLLIHPRLGSWMLLGEIVTTMAIEVFPSPSQGEGASGPGAEAGEGGAHHVNRASHPHPNPLPARERGQDHCGICTRCIDACPTDCITPYELDASRCISYLTIEHRDEIDSSLHASMGDWIAGCDLCQEVCPYNQDAEPIATRAEYATRPPGPAAPLLDILNWTAQSRQHALTRSALKRIKLDMWKRNALIAAGNYLAEHDHAALRERIKSIAADEAESAMVRRTALSIFPANKETKR